jgi:hypothetical protein
MVSVMPVALIMAVVSIAAIVGLLHQARLAVANTTLVRNYWRGLNRERG